MGTFNKKHPHLVVHWNRLKPFLLGGFPTEGSTPQLVVVSMHSVDTSHWLQGSRLSGFFTSRTNSVSGKVLNLWVVFSCLPASKVLQLALGQGANKHSLSGIPATSSFLMLPTCSPGQGPLVFVGRFFLFTVWNGPMFIDSLG